MRVFLVLLICILCLTGCGAVQTFERIEDSAAVPVMAKASQLELTYADLEEALVFDNGNSKLYMCDGYSVILQTLEGGDLGRTVREVTGLDKEKLTLMKTDNNGIITYQCAWSAVGEGTDRICRAAILDDGAFHYAVTVMTNSGNMAAITKAWSPLLETLYLSTG